MTEHMVAFGDSNTRYYFGDTGVCGPLHDAWPAQLERILRARGRDVTVKNEGHPGEQADFAVAEFGRRVGQADGVVLGFGTNDIKRPELTLEHFLFEMGAVLDQAEARGIPAAVLGIPWFDVGYAGAELQARLPGWNAGLEALCRRRAVPFIDLYRLISEERERWYNERETPMRHFSAAGQRRVAELVAEALPLARP